MVIISKTPQYNAYWSETRHLLVDYDKYGLNNFKFFFIILLLVELIFKDPKLL